MYEARQNKEKVSRRIDGDGMVRQMVKMRKFSPKVMQKAATISMTYDGQTYDGQSNKETETDTNMLSHRMMHDFFDKNVKEQEIIINNISEKDDDDWTTKEIKGQKVFSKMRNWKHCAEPNAFSKFVSKQPIINLRILENCRFPQLTEYKGVKKKPCNVCEQWVEVSDNGLKLKSNLTSAFLKDSFKKSKQADDYTNGKVITWGTTARSTVPADVSSAGHEHQGL